MIIALAHAAGFLIAICAFYTGRWILNELSLTSTDGTLALSFVLIHVCLISSAYVSGLFNALSCNRLSFFLACPIWSLLVWANYSISKGERPSDAHIIFGAAIIYSVGITFLSDWLHRAKGKMLLQRFVRLGIEPTQNDIGSLFAQFVAITFMGLLACYILVVLINALILLFRAVSPASVASLVTILLVVVAPLALILGGGVLYFCHQCKKSAPSQQSQARHSLP